MSELGSLYRQEVRLEEKLVVWRSNQMQTRRELGQVQKRRAFLEGILERGADPDRRLPSAPGKSGDGDGQKAATRQEIRLPLAEREPEPQPEVWERPQPPIALVRQRVGRGAARR